MKDYSITSADIFSFEDVWRVSLPDVYKNFLLAGNQEIFRGYAFDFVDDGKPDTSVVQDFFLLKGEAYRRLDFYMIDRLSRFLFDCIPVASDVFGNLILLKSGGDGVYFWNHENEGREDASILIALNFGDFLQSLKAVQDGDI